MTSLLKCCTETSLVHYSSLLNFFFEISLIIQLYNWFIHIVVCKFHVDMAQFFISSGKVRCSHSQKSDKLAFYSQYKLHFMMYRSVFLFFWRIYCHSSWSLTGLGSSCQNTTCEFTIYSSISSCSFFYSIFEIIVQLHFSLAFPPFKPSDIPPVLSRHHLFHLYIFITCIYVSPHMFLDISCSVCVILWIYLFSELTTWNWIANLCALF